jgi:O-antigen/teichoic acid export membrane protein
MTANLLGYVIPLAVAFIVVPPLFSILGPDRFGILVLAWAVIGYFGIFDFGLGRSVTHLVATDEGKHSRDYMGQVLGTTGLLLFALSALAMAAALLLTPSLARHVFAIPDGLVRESESFFYLMAFALPFVILSSGLRGMLEGSHQFGQANAIRIPTGIFMYVGPLLACMHEPALPLIGWALFLVRLVGFLAYVVVVARTSGVRLAHLAFSSNMAKSLLRFGGWLTVSNTIAPLLGQLDRVAIGVLLSASAVAYYATPYEVASRLTYIGVAIGGALFPLLSERTVRDPSIVESAIQAGLRRMVLLLFPPVAAMTAFAYPFLSLWIDETMAIQSTLVLQLMAVGVLANSFAQFPYSIVQASGRADLTAKIHLLETPIYVALLWLGIHFAGIVGAAAAWVGRTTIDLFLLTVVSRRIERAQLRLKSFAAYVATTMLGVVVLGLLSNWLRA